MKAALIVFILALISVLTSCHSPSQEIVEAFKTVDRSLVKSNLQLGQSLETLYQEINTNRDKNRLPALRADTLFNACNTVSKFIDSLKQLITEVDSSGTNTAIASQILVNKNAGGQLETELSAVCEYSTIFLHNHLKKASLDSAMEMIKTIRPGTSWKKDLFESTPSVGAITILSKFQNDCSTAAGIVLYEIKSRMVN